MALDRWLAVASSIALVLMYAFGSLRLVDNSSDWYLALRKPKWQPPNWVFGVIWPYNFFMLGLALISAAISADMREVWATQFVFAASVAAALAWSYYFYKPRDFVKAAIWLVTAAIITLVLMAMFARATIWVWWLAPYQLWLMIAASLSVGYAVLNRD